jgi:hypothetical protein
MPIPSEPISRPWRRFLRFSVRGLIVLVLVIGAGLGWLVRSALMQRDAVAAIQKNRGWVRYYWRDYSIVRGSYADYYWPGDLPWRPSFFLPRAWLADRFGIDYFDEIIGISFSAGATCSNADMVHVSAFPALHDLYLPDTKVTDPLLVHLEGMTNLTVLCFSGNRVTDEGLVHLKGLTKLRNLSLGGTLITDDGLIHLEGLPYLVFLDRSDSQVTDAGLRHIKGLTKLNNLQLCRTQVTDAGLAHLKTLTKLSNLELQGTRVTDAGVKELQQALPNPTIYH